jgi:hypothetical protein
MSGFASKGSIRSGFKKTWLASAFELVKRRLVSKSAYKETVILSLSV